MDLDWGHLRKAPQFKRPSSVDPRTSSSIFAVSSQSPGVVYRAQLQPTSLAARGTLYNQRHTPSRRPSEVDTDRLRRLGQSPICQFSNVSGSTQKVSQMAVAELVIARDIRGGQNSETDPILAPDSEAILSVNDRRESTPNLTSPRISPILTRFCNRFLSHSFRDKFE